MKPAPFRYERPDSVAGALECLAREGFDARPLAGGQSLIPTMNFRLAQPAVLVDLGGLEELRGIQSTGEGLRIGAMTRQAEVERSDLVRERAPLVHEIMPWVAHVQIRNRGTIGGSLAHADPAAELPAAMLALEATFVARGMAGERRVPAADFYTGLFETALDVGELLVAVEIPGPQLATGYAFEEVSRRHGDFALVGVCARVALAPDGTCSDAAVTLLSVGDGPVAANGARSVLVGQTPSEGVIRAAAETAGSEDIDPAGDIHASAEYRRHLARVLTGRALRRAADRAADGRRLA